LGASDGAGRNAWFEACEEIGEPTVFVQDVKRGWGLAEEMYDRANEASVVPVVDLSRQRLQQRQQDRHEEWEIVQRKVGRLRRELAIEAGAAVKFQLEEQIKDAELQLAELETELENLELQLSGKQSAGVSQINAEERRMRAIVLQGRYALMATTFNSLLDNLPVGVMAAFVKGGFWSVERAWAYVEQMQNEYDIYQSISVLVPYLLNSNVLFQAVREKVLLIQDKVHRVKAFISLVKIDSSSFSEALIVARSIQDEEQRSDSLICLAEINSSCFSEALEAARLIQNGDRRAEVLSQLTRIDSSCFSEALEAARLIQDENRRVEILNQLARLDTADFTALLAVIHSIEDEHHRANALSGLAQMESADFTALLVLARSMQDTYERAYALSRIGQFDAAYLAEAAEISYSILNDNRAGMLSILAQINPIYFSEALIASRFMRDIDYRAKILNRLVNVNYSCFYEALQAARLMNNEECRADTLCYLAQVN
jgi:ABC-type transporter Mla MlaB component